MPGGFDRSFASMLGDYRERKDNRVLWPAPLYGREQPYYQLAKLGNLATLPDAGLAEPEVAGVRVPEQTAGRLTRISPPSRRPPVAVLGALAQAAPAC
jgi:hypothetical protein